MKGVLKSFLLSPSLYADDVAGISDECIRRHGEQEWRAVLLTNEIHGHLGIYSTIGAKMGVRAMELLRGEGIEGEISVLSYAGSVPPVSCLNDGLQVSTGASMGHGLFALSSSEETAVKAVFSASGTSLTLRLKPEYEDIIKSDITKGIALHGHSPAYWDYVRKLALSYWLDWDRSKILIFSFC
ncbi:MAG: formylmethanofuran dehydrogenase subunit E family protein [Bacteroidales bacterium]|nr:formylmethanofuran dehydrogenase subunit E family protein [Bacteroidales bacterium]